METKNESMGFSHEDGLKTIYAMITSTRNTIGENYLFYLLWGYLVGLACISEYLLIRVVHYERHYMVWPVLMGLGMVVIRRFNAAQAKNQYTPDFYRQYHELSVGWMGSQFADHNVLCHPIAELQSYFATHHGHVWYGNICFRRSDQLPATHHWRNYFLDCCPRSLTFSPIIYSFC